MTEERPSYDTSSREHRQLSAGVPGLSRATRNSSVARILTELEDGYGGREQFAEDLGTLDQPEAQLLVQLMSDPRRRGDSLLTLAADANLAPTTILTLLKNAALQRAIIQAQLSMAGRLPEVADRIGDAAAGGVVDCACTIGGTTKALEVCPKCRGTGRQYNKPSLAHQQMLLGATDMVKHPGSTVNVQTNVGVQVGAGPGLFDQVVKGFSVALRPAPEERRVIRAALDPIVNDNPPTMAEEGAADDGATLERGDPQTDADPPV